MENKILSISLIGFIVTLCVGFYFIYSGDVENYYLGQKIVGGATLFLFFVLMPAFLIIRYRHKKLKSFIWNPDVLKDDEEE